MLLASAEAAPSTRRSLASSEQSPKTADARNGNDRYGNVDLDAPKQEMEKLSPLFLTPFAANDR